MESTAIHALYRINEGGIKTDCVEFVQYGEADTMTLTCYKLQCTKKGETFMATQGRTERTSVQVARAFWTSLKQAGYKTAEEA